MTKQTMNFQTETKQILQLMIHSMYSNKEIFLRELVSNASDALDKLRFLQVNNPALVSANELAIVIEFDKVAKTLTIKDNGVGMTRDEVIEHIGTIAKSGTKAFLENLSKDQVVDSNLIGQFGVGFYSAFIVADKVSLTTLKAGDTTSKATVWESVGDGEYTLEEVTKIDGNGTTIVLHMKDDSVDMLSDWGLRSIIRKYSDHINYPIKMIKQATPSEDAKEEVVSTEYETVNQANALWTRSKSDITNEEYVEFYKHIAHDYQDPLKWIHTKVEGSQEYTMLLYIPSKAPFDLYDANRKYGIKLYIKRVFIMDDAEKLLPNYLRFVRGIIDTQNLPLNVSREILQSSRDIDAIRVGATKKVLSLLEDMAKNEPENYAKFYAEFGSVLKEGVIEDHANKERIAKLCRFNSTREGNLAVSLETYVSRMKDKQDKIYYITAETMNAAKNSPLLEIFNKKDIEVLLLTDRVDEWVVNHLNEFDKKQLVSIAKGKLDLSELETDDEKEHLKKLNEESKPIVEKLKASLGDKVKDVVITTRLTDSPACLVLDEYGMTRQMEMIMRASGQELPQSKPVLEINPEHNLLKMIETELEQTKIDLIANVLLDQAMISEGLPLENPAQFIKNINQLLV